MSRIFPDWIAAYLEYTADHESPEKIHFWTSLAMLSAVVKRQLFMERVFYVIYPNVYVIIVAESARARKSVAMEIGIRVMKKADNKVFLMQGRMTPEGLVKCLNRTNTVGDPNGTGGTIHLDSHVLIYADELATLFGYDKASASRMAILLTETYGCPDHYPHTTAGEGVKELYNLYPTVLVATDPRNLKVMPEEAIAGLLGRLVFVHAAGTRQSKAWLLPGEKDRATKMRDLLAADLSHIGTLTGEVVPTTGARAMFETWYNKIRDTKVDDPRIDPFVARCHDTALKVAMLMSIAKNDSLSVTEDEMAAGIAIVEKQLPESLRVIQWTGATTYAQHKVKFLDALLTRGGYATRRDLMRIMEIPVDEFDGIEAGLIQEERIIKSAIPRMGIVYKLREDKKES